MDYEQNRTQKDAQDDTQAQSSTQDRAEGGANGGAQGGAQSNAHGAAQNAAQSTAQGAAQRAAQRAAQGAGNGKKADMMTLLEQSSMPGTVCQWIRCLRAPAMSLQYHVEKRHIPDLEAEAGGQSSQSNQSSQGNQANSEQSNGHSADTMTLNGGMTVRYFDLAVGAILFMTVGCLLKCCCRLKKKLF